MCLPVTPYRVEREWKHAGLSCAVVQASEGTHRCGYVRVPPGHPLFGKGYDDAEVDVHGGLTFAEIEPCTEHEDGQGWWFGFDFAHSGDRMYEPGSSLDARFPAMRFVGYEEHWWTQEEVERETEALADQLATAPTPPS